MGGGVAMTGEVICFPDRTEMEVRNILDRLQRVAALFDAIEAGELLAALPDSTEDLANHNAAVRLLAMAEIEIKMLCSDLAGR